MHPTEEDAGHRLSWSARRTVLQHIWLDHMIATRPCSRPTEPFAPLGWSGGRRGCRRPGATAGRDLSDPGPHHPGWPPRRRCQGRNCAVAIAPLLQKPETPRRRGLPGSRWCPPTRRCYQYPLLARPNSSPLETPGARVARPGVSRIGWLLGLLLSHPPLRAPTDPANTPEHEALGGRRGAPATGWRGVHGRDGPAGSRNAAGHRVEDGESARRRETVATGPLTCGSTRLGPWPGP
jgi:hypothetical protein